MAIDMHIRFNLIPWLICWHSASLSNHCLIRQLQQTQAKKFTALNKHIAKRLTALNKHIAKRLTALIELTVVARIRAVMHIGFFP
jgi:hypothetical protein